MKDTSEYVWKAILSKERLDRAIEWHTSKESAHHGSKGDMEQIK